MTLVAFCGSRRLRRSRGTPALQLETKAPLLGMMRGDRHQTHESVGQEGYVHLFILPVEVPAAQSRSALTEVAALGPIASPPVPVDRAMKPASDRL